MSRRLDSLRTLARRLSDTENATGYIPDAEVDDYINDGIRDLRDNLVDVGGSAWLRKSSNVNTVADTATVAYPSDFRSLVGISCDFSGNNFPLEPLDFELRDTFDEANGWSNHSPVYYSLEQANIRLFPTPESVYTLTIWYLADFTDLSNDADTIEAFGYERYAAYHAAICIGIKEKDDDSQLRVERDRILANAIQHWAHRRNAGLPEPPVMDVRRARRDVITRLR